MRGYDSKALFRTPVSFNKRCPLCNEEFLHCDKLGCWKYPAVSEAILANSQNKPKYSLKTSLLIGGVILALMLYGVYLGVQHGF